MMLAVLAPLLLVAAAQSPPSDSEPMPTDQQQTYPDETYPDETYPQDEPANGLEDEAAEEAAEAVEQAAEAIEEAAEAAEEAARAAEEAVEETAEDVPAGEADEDEDMVCRRVHYVDDFGRHRSRKSCRPR